MTPGFGAIRTLDSLPNRVHCFRKMPLGEGYPSPHHALFLSKEGDVVLIATPNNGNGPVKM